MFDARSILDALVRGGGGGPSPRPSGPGQGDDIFRDLLGRLGGGGGPDPRAPADYRQPPAGDPRPYGDARAPGGSTPRYEAEEEGDDRGGMRPPAPDSQTGGLSLDDLLRSVLGGGGPGGAGGGGAGGGLQEVLRDILGGGGQMGPANRMFGEGGPAGGANAGALLETLKQVLGQATSGVREGAGRLDEVTGASGHARDALGQATGQSPEELVAKLRELISGNRLAAGAALGGLGALILGTGAGRALAGTAVRLGGLALVGGLAYKAYQNYQQGRPPLTGGQPAAGGQQLAAAPTGSGFEPDAVSQEQALLYIRAMIAAAAADGRIDERERARIAGNLQQAGLGREAQLFLEGEINNPATVADLAASVASEQDAVQVYTAARIAIDLDSGAEHDFLRRLADALKIDPALAAQVDAAARGAA